MVRNFLSALIFLFAAAACLSSPLCAAQPSLPVVRAAARASEQQPPAPGQAIPSTPQLQASPARQAAPQTPSLPVIILDPAHGGTDTGARGENGLAEKDVALQIARTLQAQLLNRGYHVVMTRNDDSNPSYDDRAAVANAYSNAVFITIHVGSSGKMGTVRAFYDRFSSPIQAASSSSQAQTPAANAEAASSAPATSLISWQEAQRPYVSASRRLADILQLQFAQLFSGSPVSSISAPLRDLRSVANPAVAIEISNISAPSVNALLELSGPLSVAIEKALQAFRQGAVPETP